MNKITHEEAQHSFDVIEYETFDTQTIDTTDLLEHFSKLNKDIKQQEQQKVLELYRKFFDKLDLGFDSWETLRSRSEKVIF